MHRLVGITRAAVAVAVVLGTLLVMAGAAAAHIEPDPNQVDPGAKATVEFSVEHGCDTSPTVKLTFKIPKGVKKATPEAKDGWDATVKGKTIVFEGGPSPAADAEDTFAISFKAPKTKTVLVWKVIQNCEEGIIRWIDTSKTAEEPPPRVGVGKAPPAEEEPAAGE